MGSVYSRTFTRVTIKIACIQGMMGINKKRLMFCKKVNFSQRQQIILHYSNSDKASDIKGLGAYPPTFSRSIKKKGNQREKRKSFKAKQKLLKGCYQGQNVTILVILVRLEIKNFPCQLTMVADSTFQYFMVPPLLYPFRLP